MTRLREQIAKPVTLSFKLFLVFISPPVSPASRVRARRGRAHLQDDGHRSGRDEEARRILRLTAQAIALGCARSRACEAVRAPPGERGNPPRSPVAGGARRGRLKLFL